MVGVAITAKTTVRQADGRVSRRGKSRRGRAFDVVLSALILLALAPVMLSAALAVYLEDGGPILFSQSRLGYGGKSFRCLKFRSMCTDAEARLQTLLDASPEARAEWNSGHKLKRDPRITVVGGFLRKFSLDELPQLLNVLHGEMSLVGPRPIIQAEVWRYGRRFSLYCSLRPGLTGLWQVSGRSDSTYRSRVAMDVVYARSRGALLDLRIIAQTIPAVLFGRGSY